MSDPQGQDRQIDDAPEPRGSYPHAVRERHFFSRLVVWLIPLAALAVSAYLIETNIIKAGPKITIAFNGPVQVERDKTPLRFKGVEIGRVKNVYLSPDLKKVLVEAQLEPFADKFATPGAIFWVVHPEITAAGIQGIETLTQGAYIGAQPGKGGDTLDTFQGLSDDPAYMPDNNALLLTLITDKVDKLKPGSIVDYRGVPIGAVQTVDLDSSGAFVRIGIFVRGPFRHLINSTSRFVYSGGFEANFSLQSGAKIHLSSLTELLNGAVEIVTPGRGAPLQNHQTIKLLDPSMGGGDDSSDNKKPDEAGALKLTLVTGKVTKLKEGSEIQYRGLTVGQVDNIHLNQGSDDVDVHISIFKDYKDLVNASSKFWYSGGIQTDFSLFHGAKVQLAGLPVLLNGAVDFITPDKDAPAVGSHPVMQLFDSYQKEWGSQDQP